VTIECEMDRTGSWKVDGPERWGSLPFFLLFSASIEVGTVEASSPEPAEDDRVNCRWTPQVKGRVSPGGKS
jgi:hypothetical protein